MHNHKVFPHADKISLIRRLLIFFKFKEITAREKIADRRRGVGVEPKITTARKLRPLQMNQFCWS
jgi:hypothetical protein